MFSLTLVGGKAADARSIAREKKDLLLANRAAIKPWQNATRPYKGIEPSFQDAIQIQLFDNISPPITLFSPKFKIMPETKTVTFYAF